MNMLDLVALGLSAACCVGYICRADGLTIWAHRTEYILLHFGLFSIAFMAGVDAYLGVTGPRDWCSLLGSGAWLVVSWHTWRFGVPDHVRRRRAT